MTRNEKIDRAIRQADFLRAQNRTAEACLLLANTLEGLRVKPRKRAVNGETK